MPRPDQLCECGHERQEHRAPAYHTVLTWANVFDLARLTGGRVVQPGNDGLNPAVIEVAGTRYASGEFVPVGEQAGPCSALEPCDRCGGGGVVSRRATHHSGEFDVDAEEQPCPECEGKRFEVCACRHFVATLSAESPRTIELTREDLSELILACRAHARGWALDGRLRAEVRANYRRIAAMLDEQAERQDRDEGFCPACTNEESMCRCPASQSDAMEG